MGDRLAWTFRSRGRARCPQAGGAGTKAERGHSCPQQRRTEVKLSNVPILLSIRELLRTRMSALRWRLQNLRALRRLAHLVKSSPGFGIVETTHCSGPVVPPRCGVFL